MIMDISNMKNDRAQISIDYIIGISIFIVAFLFMYNLLTSLLLPFQINQGEVVPMAERASTVLVESSRWLAITESYPNVIDREKVGMFNSNMNTDYNAMLVDLGLSTTNINYNINVSLRYINNTLYPNSFMPLLKAGPTPDERANVGKITRLVYLSQDSQILMLDVKVWL